ncbi:hypothetical protein ACFLTH_09410 [Bacteroidota bacterium]
MRHYFGEKILVLSDNLDFENLDENTIFGLIHKLVNGYQENIGFEPQKSGHSQIVEFTNAVKMRGHSDFLALKIVNENKEYEELREFAKEYENMINQNYENIKTSFEGFLVQNIIPSMYWGQFVGLPYFKKHAETVEDANKLLFDETLNIQKMHNLFLNCTNSLLLLKFFLSHLLNQLFFLHF